MIEYIFLAKAMRDNSTASSDAASAKSTANTAVGAAERLELRLATLELTVETLLRKLLQTGQFSEPEFMKLLQEIDAEDGLVDGKRDMNRLRRECPKCRRNSNGASSKCMWCGESLQKVKPVALQI